LEMGKPSEVVQECGQQSDCLQWLCPLLWLACADQFRSSGTQDYQRSRICFD
jgi:hypothetical protein